MIIPTITMTLVYAPPITIATERLIVMPATVSSVALAAPLIVTIRELSLASSVAASALWTVATTFGALLAVPTAARVLPIVSV